MTILCIIFISPLYFLNRKKWGAFMVNAFFYGLACLCVLSIVGIMIAPVFWLIALIHASYYYKKEVVVEQAELLATKMAEKMNKG